jgi:hypothetical protein
MSRRWTLKRSDSAAHHLLPVTADVKISFNVIPMQIARRSGKVNKYRREFMLQGSEKFLQNFGRKTEI